MKRIAVIGGGPKAAALCAKAECINSVRRTVSVHVFEKNQPGSAWSGHHGYTDGDQAMCTRPERDVGFPYERGLLDEEGVQRLFGKFAWQSFLVSRAGGMDSYGDWVDRGRKPPPHSLYGEYVGWVIARSRFRLTRGEVTGLQREDDAWTVAYRAARSRQQQLVRGFDAVVVTGPGPALSGFRKPDPDDSRITNGVAFWNDPAAFLAQAGELEEPIIVVGSGGTAAAIAAWLARNDRSGRPIVIIGNQAALFTRTESFFENALFSDEETWSRLAPGVRMSVSQRLNRGIVWASVSDTLSLARNVKFLPGRVNGAHVQQEVQDAPTELRVDVEDALGNRTDAASLVIDAAGFDAWWFLDLLPPNLRRAAEAAGAVSAKDRREHLAAAMSADLSLAIGAEGLHAPMLSLAQGPGYASLMVLGAMSERILRTYVDPVT